MVRTLLIQVYEGHEQHFQYGFQFYWNHARFHSQCLPITRTLMSSSIPMIVSKTLPWR